MTPADASPERALEPAPVLGPLAELPAWLIALVQAERVRSVLARSIPECVSGAYLLDDVQISRVRLKKGRWVGLFYLSVVRTHDQERVLIQSQGTLYGPEDSLPAQPETPAALGDADWNWIVPELRLALVALPDEAELPSLPRLVDAQQSRALLETALRAASPVYANLQLEACTPRVVRYKPGSRCSILYDLVYPSGANADGRWPDLVAVKTYKGNKGRNAYEGMRSLWDSPFRTDSRVTIAEPLAYVAELNAFIQGPLREQQTLKDVIRSAVQLGTPEALAELGELMRRTARGLAALHSSGLQFGTETTWADEFGDLEETCEQLNTVVPALNDTLSSLMRLLSRRAADSAADPLVTTHGSFRPAQVLLYKEQLSFIDFDSVGLAEPALDLALFLTATKNIGLSEPHEEESNEDDTALDPAERERILDQLDGIGDEFLREYERHAPISRTRLEAWEGLNLLSLVLSCWTKIKPVRLANTLLMLERYLERVGALGAAQRGSE